MKSFKIFAVLIFLSNYTHGQIRSIYSDVDKVVSQNGIFHTLEPEQSIFIEINKGDAIKEAEEEENLIGNRLPYKFGKSVDFHHDSENSGTWIDTEGGRVWKLKISSKGAFSLSVIFSKLKLANGAQLYIYNSEGSMLSGPITSTEIPMTGGFKSDIIKGDELILELFEPKEFHGTKFSYLPRNQWLRRLFLHRRLLWDDRNRSRGVLPGRMLQKDLFAQRPDFFCKMHWILQQLKILHIAG